MDIATQTINNGAMRVATILAILNNRAANNALLPVTILVAMSVLRYNKYLILWDLHEIVNFE
ncbi:hypothetical protein SFSGTM_27620 [Sulfuriferula nivalis]|uniref:Uncharacterized protein n=1 Tax=Sulfuriferula nivalis TaxID=2675298 RepID=A0A809RMP5_9PROT|nr:hypothetical protein SFSGTM_27620 [Sulfuriferula nivalis]